MNTPLLHLFQEALETPEQGIERHYQEGRLSKAERDGKLRVCKIDRIVGEIKAKQRDHTWQPSEKHPVRVIHERRAYENRLKTMGTTIKLSGGTVRDGVIDGN